MINKVSAPIQTSTRNKFEGTQIILGKASELAQSLKSALEINSCRAYFLDEDKLGKTTNWSNLFHDEEIDFSDLRGINLMFTDPESSSLDTNKAFDRLVL